MTSGDQDSGIAGQLDESRSSTTSSFVFFRRCSLTSPFHLHQNCKTFSFLFPAPCMCQDCRTSWSPFSNVSVPPCPPQSMPSTVSYSFPDPPPLLPLPVSSKQHRIGRIPKFPHRESGSGAEFQRKPRIHRSPR